MFFDASVDAYYINIRMDAALTAKKSVESSPGYWRLLGLLGLHLHILKGKNS